MSNTENIVAKSPSNAKPVSKEVALANKLKSVTENVISTITQYTADKKLTLPPNYSAENAINALKLKIMDDEKLRSCSMTSVANTMLQMAILGLNPAKNQCYPVSFDGKMGLMTSYFGNKMIAKRINPNIEDIVADVVKQEEEFEFEHDVYGNFKVTKHTKTLESMDSRNFVAGYATIIFKDGTEPKTLIMTYNRIKESWKKSSAKPFDENGNLKEKSVHFQYTEDMIKRTVINAITKDIRNSSSDADLFSQTVDAMMMDNSQAEANEEVKEHTRVDDVVDIDYSDEEDSENAEYESDSVAEETIIDIEESEVREEE